MQTLKGTVAVVAGATRGAGRGIACMLGEAGATVYCTGRSVRSRTIPPRPEGSSAFALAYRPETIEETAEIVTARGGVGIWAQVDHTVPEQVRAFFERVRREQDGRLDLLVNDVWGGDELTEWDKPFWERSLEDGLLMLERAVHAHIITSYYGVPLMVARRQGLLIEITDSAADSGDNPVNDINCGYRGDLFYDLSKVCANRLGYAFSEELRKVNVTALAISPGYLRSEAMLDHFGVTEATWRDAIAKDRHFAKSETPFYIGRAVVALASDPNVAAKAGKVWTSGQLAHEYVFTDIDGRSIPAFTVEG
ncbi:MAG TPA: SDR family oxidoreductase [Chthonomonadaceae bacterium]|nr:SDR family oxidoreductase [Chthonomonadaceae bacterium]